jgi:hypothetical protein
MEIDGKESILAYADDIVILANTRQEITQFTSELLEASKNMELCINEDKTKCMVLSWGNENQPDLQVNNLTFEKVENFKYLGVNINSKNDMYQETSERITNGNRCYYGISKLLKSKSLSRKSKTKLYSSYLRPIITYAYETWSSTRVDNNSLAIFERKILRNIFGLVYNTELGIFEKRKNDDLHKMYEKSNILIYIKLRDWNGLGTYGELVMISQKKY